jgi:signal transduction histidine kinase
LRVSLSLLQEPSGEPGVRAHKSFIVTAAFGSLILVIALSGAAAWRNGSQLMHQVASVHDTHKRAGDALQSIRENVYLVSILSRDYLLDPDTSNAQTYVDQFASIRTQTNKAFTELQATGLEPLQHSAVERLRRELEKHWDPTEIALDMSVEQRLLRRAQLLRRGLSRRQEIFELASQVQQLLDLNLGREQARIREAEEKFAMFLMWTTTAAVLLALGTAVLTLMRLMRLEQQSGAAASELRRLSAQLRTAQEAERKSLARELHDQVGQMLTGVRMELAGLARGALSAADGQRVQHAKDTVEQLLRSVRNISMLLRPSMLDDLGLEPAINWQVKEFERVSGTKAEAHVASGLDSLPDDHRTCLYRVVQEALTNCGRHAQAKSVRVKIERTPDALVATITDDGVGFDATGARGRGLGLIGMQERVRELEGEFTVTSSPGRGTRISARIPLPPAWRETNDSNPSRRRSRHHPSRVETSA